MAGNANAQKAATALAGGAGPRPTEDGVEVGAIFGACQVLTDETIEDAAVYVTSSFPTGPIVVGFAGMSGQEDLTSAWTPYKAGGGSGTWTGLKRWPQ